MLYRTSLNAPVFGLRREIDRLFEDTFGRDNASSWTPAVDVRENQNELRLDLELPGINADEVEITTDNGVLTVRGEKHSERKEEDDARYHVVERSYGSFTRSFQLPQGPTTPGSKPALRMESSRSTFRNPRFRSRRRSRSKARTPAQG